MQPVFLLLKLVNLLLCRVDSEEDSGVGMVLLEVRNLAWRLVSAGHHTFQERLVVLRPLANWQLGDTKCSFINALNLSLYNVASLPFSAFRRDLEKRKRVLLVLSDREKFV